MAIKVSGETVVTNARRGVFTKMNPGAYATADLPSSSSIGDTIYNSSTKQLLSWNGSEWAGTLPAGTTMVFYQKNAPVGWTKLTDTAISNAALRTITGTAGGTTAGTSSFSSVFSSRSVPLLAHTHSGDTGNNSKGHSHSGDTGNNSRGHTHSGDTGNQSRGHTHSGNTGNQSRGHNHSVSVNSGGSHSHGINDPGHTHSYSRRTGSEEFQLGSRDASDATYGSANTGSKTTGIGIKSAGSHTHGTTVGNQSQNHTHGFTTGGISQGHTHEFTTGGISQNHTHEFTTSNQSQNHTHAFTTGSTGTAGASMDFAVKYLNVIVARKN